MDEGANRVLVCPLGWGLGHASRLIPIITQFQESGFEVIPAGDKQQMDYISSYFPHVNSIIFPSFNVRLTKGSSQLLPILGIGLRLPYHIIKEHFALKRIVKQQRINYIISDNRYGLWQRGIKTVLITHQLRIPFPKPFRFLEPLGELFVRLISQRFTYCWIPDYPGDNSLAGKLSHPVKPPVNTRYIGLLSRFQNLRVNSDFQKWDLVGIASGPSPQREILIELMGRLSKRYNLKTLIIKGNPSEGMRIYEDKGISYAGHLDDIDFANAILSTKHLITRAGYSTIMDMVVLGVSGLIIPTPGQTEQEYLADYLSKKGLFKTCKQRDLELVDISNAQIIQRNIKNSSNLFENAFIEFSASKEKG